MAQDQLLQVAVITASDKTAEHVQALLSSSDRGGYGIQQCSTRSDEIKEMLNNPLDICLVDIDDANHSLITAIHKCNSHCPVILLTKENDKQAEALMIKYGASDYIVKESLSYDLLHRVLQYSIQRKQITDSFLREKQRLEAVTGIMTVFLRTNDWAAVSKQILQQVLLTISADAAFIAVLNENGSHNIIGSFPENSWSLNSDVLAEDSITRLDSDELQTVLLKSLNDSLPMATTSPFEEAFKTLCPTNTKGFDHFLSLPLTNQSEIVGFVGITRENTAFTGRENLNLFTILQTSGVVFDIYRRQKKEVQLEDQLRRSQKMESVGRLAGGVAHDFNNLLTVINGYSEILLENTKEEGAHQRELNEILKAGKNAAQLTRQLLAFGRRQVFSPDVVNINNIFSNLENMYRHMLKDDVSIEAILAEDVGLVHVDISQIEQVVINLIINSQDAMPQGGKLTIKTENVSLKKNLVKKEYVIEKGEYVSFSISDTGQGIEGKHLENIFEPFFTTKQIGRGPGLGLAMVYGIVKQSGGYIVVDSQVGYGTTMKIYFPRVIKMKDQEDINKENWLKHSGTVLVVDDDREVLTLAGEVLRDKGFKVLEAYNPGEACFIAEKENVTINMMLTDVVMPIMNGRELVERIQLKKPDMKVLYMSGCSEEDIIEYGIDVTDNNFLRKPFNISELVEKIELILDMNSKKQ